MLYEGSAKIGITLSRAIILFLETSLTRGNKIYILKSQFSFIDQMYTKKLTNFTNNREEAGNGAIDILIC